MAVLSLKHEEELKVLAEKKTQELQNIQELRLAKLESIIQVKDKEILKLSEERQKLAADFQHNLSLLQQRDEDLEKYNSVVLEAKSELNRKNQLISDLRITIDRQNAKQKSNEELLDSERNKLQKRLDEQKRHILVYCRNKEETLEAERKRHESMRRKYHQQLLDLQDDLSSQKNQMMAQFDDALRRREHEYRCKMDEVSVSLQSKEQTINTLHRESTTKAKQLETLRHEIEEKSDKMADLERLLQDSQLRYMEEVNGKDTRLAELEVELKHCKAGHSEEVKHFEDKINKLDMLCNQKDLSLKSAVKCHKEKILKLEKKFALVEKVISDQEKELEQLHLTAKERDSTHKVEIEELEQRHIETTARHNAELSRCLSTSDGQQRKISSLERQCDILRMEVGEKNQAIAKYKTEVAESLERERNLERELAQKELDHQADLEEKERLVYQENERIIAELKSARDQALANVAKLTEELTVIRKAFQARTFASGASNEGHLKELEDQNMQLRSIVNQMKKEMESLSKSVPESSNVEAPITKSYVRYLEQEVSRLKRISKRAATQRRSPQTEPRSKGSVEVKSVETAIEEALEQVRVNREQQAPSVLELSQKIKSLEAALKYAKPHAQGTLMNQLKLKLLQASMTIANLVFERDQFAAVVRVLAPRLTAQSHDPARPAESNNVSSVPDTVSESDGTSSRRKPPSGLKEGTSLHIGVCDKSVQYEAHTVVSSRHGDTASSHHGDIASGHHGDTVSTPLHDIHPPVIEGSPGGDSEDALDMSLSTLKFEDSLGLSKDKADLLAFLGSVASPTPR